MIDVGPRYGVRAYFRDLRNKTRDLSGPVSEDWFERACAATRRPMTPATIQGMIADHAAIILDHGGFGFIESWTSVMGKPACHSTGYIPIAARIRNHPSDGTPPYDEDVVLVRRLDVEISSGKMVYSMATAHLAITRHALERLYERSRCHQDTFAQTVREELLRTLCGLAIAAAAEIGSVRRSRPADYHHHAIPFGSGLMLFDGRLFTDWNAGGGQRIPLAQHHHIKGGKSKMRRPQLSRFNSMTIPHPELTDETVWASRVFTTRTYVDRDDMTRTKMAYCDTFDTLLDQFDFQPLLQAYFRPRPYEDQAQMEVDLPGEAIDMLSALLDSSGDIFTVERSLPVCSVRTQEDDSDDLDEKENDMKYNKGKAGPVSRNEIEIVDAIHVGTGPNAYARGNAILRKADSTLKDVSFMVQGGNYAALREQIKPGARMRVPVRWTGGHAVTIVDEKTLAAYRESQSGRKAA